MTYSTSMPDVGVLHAAMIQAAAAWVSKGKLLADPATYGQTLTDQQAAALAGEVAGLHDAYVAAQGRYQAALG